MDKGLQLQFLRGFRVILIIALIVILFLYVLPLIYPFLFGVVIAYLLNPLVNLLQKKARFPRWLAVTLSLILFISIVAGLITLVIINITIEIGSLTETIQQNINLWKEEAIQYINSDYIQNILVDLSSFYEQYPQIQTTINSNLSGTTTKLADLGSLLITGLLNVFILFIKLLPSIATLMIIGLLAAFFISKDWPKLIAKLASFFSEKTKESTRAITADLQKALFGYFRAQLILITLTAVVVLLGLIILKVKYAITISLIIGFVDLLPYLGTGFVMVPWIVYMFIQGNFYLAIGLSILYAVILIARQILEPKVLATSVGLDPLATLISMFVGLKLFGVLGLIIGPVTLILWVAFYKANVFRDIYYYVRRGSIFTE
mgnify:CR=1 FL=1